MKINCIRNTELYRNMHVRFSVLLAILKKLSLMNVLSNTFSFICFSKMVVPKRAAMLLDRIIVALSHALEDNDEKGVQRITDLYKSNRHIANDARFQKETMHRLRGI